MQVDKELLLKIRHELRKIKGGKLMLIEQSGKSQPWIDQCLNGSIKSESRYSVIELALTIIEQNKDMQSRADDARQQQIVERASAILGH